MKKIFEFICYELSFFLLKLFIPLGLIFYFGIYTLLGNEIRTRWGYIELEIYESWIWILLGITIIIYNFEVFKWLRVKELEKYFNGEYEEEKETKKRETPLKEDPIEQLWEDEDKELKHKKSQRDKFI